MSRWGCWRIGVLSLLFFSFDRIFFSCWEFCSGLAHMFAFPLHGVPRLFGRYQCFKPLPACPSFTSFLA